MISCFPPSSFGAILDFKFNSCFRLIVVTLPIGTNDFYDLRSIHTGSEAHTVCYVRVNLKVVAFCEVTPCTL